MDEVSEVIEDIVKIPISVNDTYENKDKMLKGVLSIPPNSNFLVIFVHGSGSGKNSERNKYLAQFFNKDGLATLLVDLLTEDEVNSDIRTEKIRSKIPGLVLNKFNMELLTKRIISITDWMIRNTRLQEKRFLIGYFGSSTGSTAMIEATGHLDSIVEGEDFISVLVSRGGRVDLTKEDSLSKIKIPTLFVIGQRDHKSIIESNKKVLEKINSEKKKLVLLQGASHLFEEPGKIEEVAKIASGWFRCYFQIKAKSIQV